MKICVAFYFDETIEHEDMNLPFYSFRTTPEVKEGKKVCRYATTH